LQQLIEFKTIKRHNNNFTSRATSESTAKK